MTAITTEQVARITSLAELDDASPTSAYSGRYMYGDRCVGWDLDTTADILRLGAAITTVMGDDAPGMLGDATSDSMGRGTIVYFPGWTCDEPVGGDLCSECGEPHDACACDEEEDY